MNTTQINLIEKVANELCYPNNSISTLEIKNELRKREPNFPWYQSDISQIMDDFQSQGKFEFTTNGIYRVYSIPQTQPKAVKATVKVKKVPTTAKISKSGALSLIEASNGKLFSATYLKKDNTERKIVGIYLSTNNLGYVKVKDIQAIKNMESDIVKTINLQTLSELKINGIKYILG